MQENALTLDSVGNGIASEKFQRELAAVLENILDPNTEPDAKREINLKFSFKANEDRDELRISVEASSKLAGSKAFGATAFVGRVDNQPVAVIYNPKQLNLPSDTENPFAKKPVGVAP